MVKFFPNPFKSEIDVINKNEEKKIRAPHFESNYLKDSKNSDCKNEDQPWHSLWNTMEKYKSKYQNHELLEPELAVPRIA